MYVNDNIYNIATCWKIETTKQDVIGITNHGSDLTIDGIVFHSNASFTPNELKKSADLKHNFLTIEGMLSHDLISKKSIELGEYDNAKIDIFLVDYNNPENFKTNVFAGLFGQISFDDNQYQVEIYRIGDALSTKFGDVYSAFCRAEFCDKKCKLNINNYTYQAKVISVLNEYEIILMLDKNLDLDFTDGLFEYFDDKGIKKSIQIFEHSDTLFKLKNKFSKEFKFGDQITLKLGCDKRLKTCVTQFNNGMNFRGEPHVPSNQLFS